MNSVSSEVEKWRSTRGAILSIYPLFKAIAAGVVIFIRTVLNGDRLRQSYVLVRDVCTR
ncbi:hypothetical protein HW132_15115 [Brasilonema sp. CT11]|nr:hypothetical protein [Brasilonema sp. CT11]